MIFSNYIKTINDDINYNIENVKDNTFLSTYFSSISDINYNETLYADLDILKQIKKIDKTITFFGGLYFNSKLLNPSSDINKLLYNKNNILQISNDYNLLKDKLIKIKNIQNSLIHIFDTNFTKNKNIQTIYFNDLLEQCNQNETLLNYYNIFNVYFPIYNIISPIILLVIPIIFKKLFPDNFFSSTKFIFDMIFLGVPDFNITNITDFKTLFTKCISILFFLYNLYISVKFSYHTTCINMCIKNNLENIKTIVNTTNDIYNIIGNKLKYQLLESTKVIKDLEYIETNNNGVNLKLYKTIIKNKEDFIPYIKFIAFIDYLVSINTLMYNKYNLVTYTKNEPKLVITDFKHPFLDNSIPNSINISNNKNIIITGPNASGKSTLIKSIIINILMAQTIGVSLSTEMTLTPFKNIYSFLNTNDILGSQSLFQTEIKNIGSYLNILKNKENSFIIVDEILKGTNHTESTKISSAICKKLNSVKNNISIITTHNNILTNLEKTNDSTNYKMELNTYKLNKGISTDFLGIEILKKSNFDKDIINSII
jgi:hypothetical protein